MISGAKACAPTTIAQSAHFQNPFTLIIKH